MKFPWQLPALLLAYHVTSSRAAALPEGSVGQALNGRATVLESAYIQDRSLLPRGQKNRGGSGGSGRGSNHNNKNNSSSKNDKNKTSLKIDPAPLSTTAGKPSSTSVASKTSNSVSSLTSTSSKLSASVFSTASDTLGSTTGTQMTSSAMASGTLYLAEPPKYDGKVVDDPCKEFPASCKNGEELTRRFDETGLDVLDKRMTRSDPKVILTGGDEFQFKMLNNPPLKDIFNGPRGASVYDKYIQFADDELDNLEVVANPLPANRGDFKSKYKGKEYIIEHPLELQIVRDFIEAANSGVLPSGKQLTQRIDDQWFLDCWKEPLTTQQKKDMKYFAPTAPEDPAGIAKRDTVNGLVFEAIGSSTNRKRLMFLDKDINTRKEKLWTFEFTMGEGTGPGSTFGKLVRSAVAGAESSRKPLPTADRKDLFAALLTKMRTHIGALAYMNHKDTQERLNGAIEDVGTQLQYIEEVVKDKSGNPATGLAQIWDEFIQDYLKKVASKAQDILEDRVTAILKEFKAKQADLDEIINDKSSSATEVRNAKGWKDNLTKYTRVLAKYEKADLGDDFISSMANLDLGTPKKKGT